jgi:hypothetical protein
VKGELLEHQIWLISPNMTGYGDTGWERRAVGDALSAAFWNPLKIYRYFQIAVMSSITNAKQAYNTVGFSSFSHRIANCSIYIFLLIMF